MITLLQKIWHSERFWKMYRTIVVLFLIFGWTIVLIALNR